VTIDPFLYVAFGIGLLAGRLTRWRSVWVGRSIFATILVLIFTLGASLGGLNGITALLTIPEALGFAGLILGLTAGISLLLPRPPVSDVLPVTAPSPLIPPGLIFLAALVIGFLIGRIETFATGTVLTGSLYVLLALVAFDLQLNRRGLHRVWIPLTAAVSAATIAGLLVGVLSPLGVPATLATTFGFGWYTLAGPLVAARVGTAIGLFAFLTNFFRENLTMVLAPWAGDRLKGEGLTALGGATAMDTTLYFITRYGDREAGSLALTSGLILTVAASLLLPLFLSLTGA
jgi:uncharacterized membrane protein YbjE (DUF340 family)